METHRSLVVVVDDHELLRQLTARLLEGHDLEVVALGDPQDALELARTRGDELALLISDVSMPGMAGPRLGELVREICPGVPLLFITGFAAEAVAQRLPADSQLLEKPFTRDDLLTRVRNARAADPRP